MKLLLVDNLVMPDEGSLALLDVHPHLGLLSIASVAQAEGHHVSIYDPKRLIRWGALPYDATLYERIAQDLLAQSPDAVGFTTLGCSFLFALNVAGLLKRREPGLPVLLGGPHATMLHEKILERFAQFDVVVRHEAEEILPAVLANLEQRRFDGIPGVSWRGSRSRGLCCTPGRPKVDDLDSLPLLSYDLYPVADLGLDLMRIEAGRGCPFMCTFCSTASFFQRSFRLKSAGRLVLELDRLHLRYGFSDYKLDHDMFTVNRRKVIEFCEAVGDRGYRWRASARVDCVDEELLRRMADAGCVGLYFGIETGSERMQRIARKRLDLGLVDPMLRYAQDLGIETTASFITGYPEETEQDQDDTLDLLGRCFRPACIPQLHLLAPEPGTPLFEELGDRLEYDGYATPYNARLLAPQDPDHVLGHPDIFPMYHYYPAQMPRWRYVLATEIVDVLRRLGPMVFEYALRFYGGRLSALAADVRAWKLEEAGGGGIDARSMEAFVAARFGPRHHLASLVRHVLRAWVPPTGTAAAAPSAPVYEPERAYRIGTGVEVLEELHDCAALIRRIGERAGRSEPLAEDEAGELGTYVLRISGAAATTYGIDPGAQAILELFREPRRCSDVAALVRDATGGSEIDGGFFRQLVGAGILVAVDTTSGGAEALHDPRFVNA